MIEIIYQNVNSYTDLFSNNYLQNLDMNFYMYTNIIPKIDIAGMANGLEIRPPYLDDRIIEFGKNIKNHTSLFKTKLFLREYIKNTDISFLNSKKKHGFAFPLSVWFKLQGYDYLNNKLKSSNKFLDFLKTKEDLSFFNSKLKLNNNELRLAWSIYVILNWLDKKELIKQNKGLTYLFLSIFFFYQIYLMYQGGSTYDLFDLWLGSGYIYQKLQAYFNLDFSNEIFQNELGQLDFFGYFFLFPAYVIERRINKISYNSSNEPINFLGEQFPSEDALTFFSIHLVLIIYSFVILIVNKIENIYSRKYSIIFIISLLLVPSFRAIFFNVKIFHIYFNCF